MYKSFKVERFRGFQDLEIKDLDHINIIAGKNNSGKTSLLEALFIHSGGVNPSLALSINAFRGMGQFQIQTDPDAELPFPL